MRVLLDATGLGSGAGGDETMLTGVLEGLALVAQPGDAFDVVAAEGADLPPAVGCSDAFTVTRIPRRAGIAHFTAVMPGVVARARPRPDLVFSPTHGPIRSRVPVALMVQDLSFEHRPGDYPLATRLRLQQVVRRQVRTARVVLTVSEHARGDLIATYGLDPARVFHVPNAALPPLDVSDLELQADRAWLAEQGVTGPYICYLGNLHPRKNVVTAIEAFALARRTRPEMSDLQFVIAGGRWWGSGEQEAASAAPPGSVVFLGRVGEGQREVLLRDAVALVYLSLFEGFGLPPLEAMTRGTPVVASDRTSIPEVVGDGGILVDPLDVAAVADAVAAVATDGALRSRLVAAGLRRAETYSVRATGEALRKAFDAALGMEPIERGAAMAAGSKKPATVRTVADYAEDWEQNARADARFAILSDPGRNDRAWEDETDAFMESGEQEIARVFEHLDSHGLAPDRRRRALDFGCGIGRLTNALGRRFDAAVGVDISPTMVEKATEHAIGDHVTFVVNQADDLGQFDDESFDFVYSNIVLQHVSNDLQRAYLAEFCRILAPGGLAVVQLPSQRRGLKGTVRRFLPPAATNVVRRFLRPAESLRREGYTIRMEMNCLPETDVWRLVEDNECVVVHTGYSNAAEADFNGNLVFLDKDAAWARAAGGGFVSPVYVIRRTYT